MSIVTVTRDYGYNAEQADKWDAKAERLQAAGAPATWVNEARDKAYQWANGRPRP